MPDITTDTLVDGRYKVVRRVGSGGMADVYCAEDTQLGRRVALKLLHRRFAADPEFVERFRREAQSAAGLQHPNVVGVFDRGEWDGTGYIAMEFVDGQTLKDLIRAEAPIAPGRAIDITEQILKAARFAHKRGVIHRDLKPHNVIVDAEDRVKVTDFGIARAGASDMTETGSILGTAQYLSPEQAQGHAVGARSDLYAVGVILYELLTGRVPFEADSAVTIALKHVTQPPPPPRELNPAIPPALEAVVLWAMEKDPDHRPADADAFLAALGDARRALSAEGNGSATTNFAAYPAGPLDPEEDDVRDRRRRRAALVALLLLLLAGGALAAYLLTRPDRVDVPRVVGESLTVAQTRLQNQGFDVNVIRRTNARPKDEVIAQDPLAGERVDKGGRITLTVSDGPGQGAVPDVAGLSRTAAVKAVHKAGFKARVRERTSDSVPQGKAIGTAPGPDSQLDKGRTVTIFLSSGPQLVAVPDVTGQDSSSARAQLIAAGFAVAQGEQESGATAGTVLSQSPGGGARVARGTTVKIVVAKAKKAAPAAATAPTPAPTPAPTTASVPDVTGKSTSDAQNALAAAGFQSSVQKKKVSSPTQDGKVLSQSPGGGSKAKKGGSVTITVGSFTPPNLNPNEQPGTSTDGSGGATGDTSTPGSNRG